MTDMTKLPEGKPYYLQRNTSFAQVKPEDELLHPASFKNVQHDMAMETQYFGFSIPEENIHAMCQLCHLPNLGTVMGGLIVFRGVKADQVQADICDWRNYMSDDCLKNDLHEYRFPSGYGVKVIEPFKRHHITYADPVRKSSIDLMVEGVLPAVMHGNGEHFDQTTRVTGELVIRGKRYKVDCFGMRDRSWGKPRPEMMSPLPPMSYLDGTFSKDFSFCCTVMDHAGTSPQPELKNLAVADDQALGAGWVWRDGKLGRWVDVKKRITRGSLLAECLAIELSFTDDLGRQFDMRSTMLASCPYHPWFNMLCRNSLMRWECEGLVGYGDNMECLWHDYYGRFGQPIEDWIA